CGRRAAIVKTAPHAAEEVNFTSIESPSLQFLPRQQEAPEWKLDEDPIVIPGDHLASYLDGDAAHFANYDTLDLAAGKYSALAGDGFATVEIFRFPDFVKAFGAYSMRKQGTYRILKLPNESFAKPHSIHLWRGPFYVRIVGDGGSHALMRPARRVCDPRAAGPRNPV